MLTFVPVFISAADVADLIVTLDDEKAWLNPYPEDLLGLSTPIFYPPDYSLECLSVGAGHSPNIDPLDYSFIVCMWIAGYSPNNLYKSRFSIIFAAHPHSDKFKKQLPEAVGLQNMGRCPYDLSMSVQ